MKQLMSKEFQLVPSYGFQESQNLALNFLQCLKTAMMLVRGSPVISPG